MAGRLNRGAIVALAADLGDEIGLDALTITEVGRAAGISAPGVYRHVADVADLRRAIGALAADELAETLSQASGGLSGADALAAVASSLRAWAAEHPGRYAAMQVAPDPDDAEGIAAAGRLIAILSATLRAYELEGDDLTDAIRLLRSTVHGFVLLEAHDGFKDPRDVDATFRRIVASLDTVLRSWSE